MFGDGLGLIVCSLFSPYPYTLVIWLQNKSWLFSKHDIAQVRYSPVDMLPAPLWSCPSWLDRQKNTSSRYTAYSSCRYFLTNGRCNQRCHMCGGHSEIPLGWNSNISIFCGGCNPWVTSYEPLDNCLCGLELFPWTWNYTILNTEEKSNMCDRLFCFEVPHSTSESSIRLLEVIETRISRKQIVRKF